MKIYYIVIFLIVLTLIFSLFVKKTSYFPKLNFTFNSNENRKIFDLTISKINCSKNKLSFVICNNGEKNLGKNFFIKIFTESYNGTKAISFSSNLTKNNCQKISFNIPETRIIYKIEIIPRNFCQERFEFEVNKKC